uniref:Uncharacterized protein n=1 Tax=Trichobilharzia regenti TaxID=157069 RepID=A0AA85IST5_TRIRE|nr:unnamed protein product [Trichobilharzia regenti]
MSTTAKLNKGSVQPERDVELNADAAAEGAVSTFVSSAAVSFQTNLSSIMSTDFVACSNNVDSNDSVPETDTEIAEADLEEKQRLISQKFFQINSIRDVCVQGYEFFTQFPHRGCLIEDQRYLSYRKALVSSCITMKTC